MCTCHEPNYCRLLMNKGIYIHVLKTSQKIIFVYTCYDFWSVSFKITQICTYNRYNILQYFLRNNDLNKRTKASSSNRTYLQTCFFKIWIWIVVLFEFDKQKHIKSHKTWFVIIVGGMNLFFTVWKNAESNDIFCIKKNIAHLNNYTHKWNKFILEISKQQVKMLLQYVIQNYFRNISQTVRI